MTRPQTPFFDADLRRRRKLRIAQLESDMAYFQARLEIIAEPRTSNQKAQRRTFKLLYRALGGMMLREKRKLLGGS